MTIRPTYANVVSTLALVVAVGSGGAYAASLAKNSVTTREIKNGTIHVVDLADGSVSAEKLAPGAVPNPLTDGSVTTAKLADGSVTADKLAPGAVPDMSIPDGSITGNKLANGAVGSGKLADGAVGTGKLADGAVGTGKLADGAVGSAKVADDSLTGTDINESSLGKVPNAGQADFANRSQTVLAAGVRKDGTLLVNHSYGVSSVQRTDAGFYVVTFNRDLSLCSNVVSPTKWREYPNDDVAEFARTLASSNLTGSQLLVEMLYTLNSGGASFMDSGFSVIVVC